MMDFVERNLLLVVVAFPLLLIFFNAFWVNGAFNVADSAITVGVVAMLADMIGLDRHASRTV